MLEFSRSIYLCNHLLESIHSLTKGTLPNPIPPYPTLPNPTLPYSYLYLPYPYLPYPFYTPGIYADGYIVFAFPFVRSSIRMFVSSFVCSYFRHVRGICVKVLRQSFSWCISQQLLIRKHSYLDHSNPGGLAFTP